MEKPNKELYGFVEQPLFGEEGGWTIEGGEEAYNEALEKWQSENFKIIEFKAYVTTGYIGADITDTLTVEVQKNATEEEIKKAMSEVAEEWLFENIEFSYWREEENE